MVLVLLYFTKFTKQLCPLSKKAVIMKIQNNSCAGVSVTPRRAA